MPTYPLFPKNPEIGETFSFPGWERYTYVWDGSLWQVDNNGVTAGLFCVDQGDVTTFSGTETPTKLLVTSTQDDVTADNFVTTADGRLTVTYTERPFMALFIVNGEVTCGSNNQEYHFYLYKNGALIDDSQESHILTGNSNTERHFTIAGVVPLQLDDYVEVWVEAHTSTAALTLTSLNLHAIRL